MRLFVVCLLSLGIAVQGHASVRVMDAACPMQPVVQAAVEEVQSSAAPGHLHHAGMDHAQHATHAGHDHPGHGKHCQHDVGCQSATPALASSVIALVSAAPATQAPAASALSFRSHIPPLLARPPAQS